MQRLQSHQPVGDPFPSKLGVAGGERGCTLLLIGQLASLEPREEQAVTSGSCQLSFCFCLFVFAVMWLRFFQRGLQMLPVPPALYLLLISDLIISPLLVSAGGFFGGGSDYFWPCQRLLQW